MGNLIFTPAIGVRNDLIPGQVYDLAPRVIITSGTTIRGARVATDPMSIINCPPGPNGEAIHVVGDDVGITGCRWIGGGIHIDESGKRNERIVIRNNEFFTDVTKGDHRNCITFTSGLKDSIITDNLFKPKNAGFAIYGYNYNNLWISNNEFIFVGMHIDCQGGGDRLLIEQNYLSQIAGMGMEIQTTKEGGVIDCIFQDNWFENPDVEHAGSNSMAYSIPLDKGLNTIVRRNYAQSPLITTDAWINKKYTRIMFELGGKNLLASDNYSLGGNHCIAVNGANATGEVSNNHIEQYRQGATNNDDNNAKARLIDNDAFHTCLWLSRGRPRRNQRFGNRDPVPIPPETSGPTVGELLDKLNQGKINLLSARGSLKNAMAILDNATVSLGNAEAKVKNAQTFLDAADAAMK